MPDRITLANLTFALADPIEVVDLAAAAGFAGVGFRLRPAAPNQPRPLLDGNRDLLRRVARRLRGNTIEASDVDIIRLATGADVRGFRPFFEDMATLECRQALVAGDDPDAGRLGDAFAALCALADEYGVTVNLEFMPWTPVRDVAGARAIVEHAGASNAGVLIDALHWQKCGSSLAEIEALPSRMLRYVQLCDGPAKFETSDDAMIHAARNERMLPGAGAIDLVALVRAMPADFTFSAEVPSAEMVARHGLKGWLGMVFEATREVLGQAGRRLA